jgi:hypothetical protein
LVGCLALAALCLGLTGSMASATSPKKTIELEGNGLGVVRFGDSERTTTKVITAVLGAPTGHPSAGCVGDFTQAAWHDLLIQFKHGRFSGYRYWVSASGIPLSALVHPDPKLATAAGITLDSTFAQIQAAYPLRQTGTDFWISPEQIVFALESPTYPSPPTAPVYEIRSHDICPAAL